MEHKKNKLEIIIPYYLDQVNGFFVYYCQIVKQSCFIVIEETLKSHLLLKYLSCTPSLPSAFYQTSSRPSFEDVPDDN
jgi:hypothetical protein